MTSRKRAFLGLVAGLTALLSRPVAATTIYDLGDFPFTGVGFTDVSAKLETAVTGVFTSEADIENFFNISPYTIVVTDGPLTRFELNNSNSAWDFEIGGIGASAVLTVTPAMITLAFFTPEEISGGALLLRNMATLDNWQYRQSNNVTDFNFVAFSTGNIVDADGSANLPFGTAFIFPAEPSGVSEPSALLLLGTVLTGLLRLPRRRNRLT